MSFGSYKSSGSLSESMSSSFSSDSSSGSESLGSLSDSDSFSSNGSSDSGLSDSGSSDSLSSSGGSGDGGGGGGLSSSSGSGSGSEGGMEYYVYATVDVTFEGPGPIASAIMEGNRSGFAVVKNDGDSAGGLFCDWADTPGVHHSIISGGNYTEPYDFAFVWNTNDSTMLWHQRTLRVTNYGPVDIVVNGTTISQFDTIYVVNTSESANWATYNQSLSVTRA